MSEQPLGQKTGGCLCGGLRYRITGACRNIINCHCENCRRTHGHVAAYTAVDRSALQLESEQTLRWFHDRGPDTYRGFCEVCGASLFWHSGDGRQRISVAAGSLDDATGLETIGHIHVNEAGRYYTIEDELPCFEGGSGGALEIDQGS